MNLKNVRSIAAKELALYFNAPIAYIVIACFLLLTGFFFTRPVFVQNFATIRHYLEMLPLFMLFFIPAITMRIYSEEYKTGTIELMYTLPFTRVEVLAGKYLASAAVIGAALALTLVYPLSILLLGPLDIGAAAAGFLGAFLLALMFTSMGVLGSSLTRNQIVSFILGFLLMFVFFIIGKLTMFLPPAVTYAGFDLHYDNFVRGVVDLRDVVYFCSVTGAILYITHLVTAKEQ
jgi:ABC-2 type transport system permease protein